MKPTDVYLLTGCLGAGKTSALNHLLREPALAGRRVALLVNEFGELGIDGKLVEAEGVPLYELNRGSLFCACIRHDAVAALKAIALKVDPELLLVEATGLADPADLEQWLLAPGGGLPVVDGGSVAAIDLSARYRLSANTCLVDGANFSKVAAFLKTAVHQVAAADGLVINKSDLLPPEARERLSALLREINPRAPQRWANRGAIDWEFLAGLEHRRCARSASEAPPADIVAWSSHVGRADRARFDAAMETLGERLLRLKGELDFGDGPMLVESVFGQMSFRPSTDQTSHIGSEGDRCISRPETSQETNELPARERLPALGLTAIGWRITRAELGAILSAALTNNQ